MGCMQVLVLAIWMLSLALGGSQKNHEAASPDFCTSVMAPFTRYSCVEYLVKTKDGFTLAIQKIALASLTYKGDFAKQNRGVVLFLPTSLVSTSEVWFDNMNTSMALATAHHGYIVWIGNYRASPWSPNKEENWDWCTDELAQFDVPALLEFVYTHNNQNPFHLIAYSEGSRVMVLTMILHPEKASQMLKSVTLMAPIIFLHHVRSPLMSSLSLSHLAEIGYNSGGGRFSFEVFANIVPGVVDFDIVKEQLLATLMGDSCCTNPTHAFNVLTRPTSFTSYKQIASLTQAMRFGSFQAYDYGSVHGNKLRYEGRSIAPHYDVNGSIVNWPKSLPILVVYGGKDGLANHHDVRNFTYSLPTRPRLLYLHNYSHIDFVFSQNIFQDLTVPIFHFLTTSSKRMK